MLNIVKTIEDGKAVLALGGRLDTVTAPVLEKELKPVLSELRELTMDLADLEYISSAGLRVLLSAQKTLGNEGAMKLTHVNETVMEVFEVTGFTDILTIEEDKA